MYIIEIGINNIRYVTHWNEEEIFMTPRLREARLWETFDEAYDTLNTFKYEWNCYGVVTNIKNHLREFVNIDRLRAIDKS